MATRNKPAYPPDYSYTLEGAIISIIDLDRGNMSVTNGMEWVLDEIRRKEGLDTLDGFSVVYRDSLLRWDGVILGPNQSIQFYPLGETTEEGAKNRLLHPIGRLF